MVITTNQVDLSNLATNRCVFKQMVNKQLHSRSIPKSDCGSKKRGIYNIYCSNIPNL